MISCQWEDGKTSNLRHVTLDALVVKDNKILLVKRAEDVLREPGKYALPGGFLDMNETPAEGVTRELLEETGYSAKIATPFRIIGNPNRRGTDTQDVDFVFLVEVDQKVREADKEISSVDWYELEKLPAPDEFAFDHYEIIQLYIDYLKENFALPILDI